MTGRRFRQGRLEDDTGATVSWPRFGLVGHPVSHSLSPQLHTAALAATEQAGEYLAVDVESHELEACLRDAASEGCVGLNVTVPHKLAALHACSRRSEEAESVGAANTLVLRDGQWHAHNTDVRGLALALERARGRTLSQGVGRVDVLGSGGAARAALACVRALGVRDLRLWARRPEIADWARSAGARVGSLTDANFASSQLLLQCTSLGLKPDDPSPANLDSLPTEALAVDLVYAPRPTAFQREALARGCETIDGRTMLIAQAALAFGMWTGEDPPLTTMAASIEVDW